jgi:putative ABC transport system permease protein
MVMAQSLYVAGGGMLIGLAAAVGLSRSLRRLLFGIEPLDVVSFAAVTILFVLVVGIAAWLPARRATRIVPMIALRTE